MNVNEYERLPNTTLRHKLFIKGTTLVIWETTQHYT
jgi:hypothetical protein